MTSATAFRSLYKSKSTKQEVNQMSQKHSTRVLTFIENSKQLMSRIAHPRRWALKKSNNPEKSFDTDSSHQSEILPHIELRTLPQAYMTGLRTVVLDAGSGQTSVSMINTMLTPYEEENLHDHLEKRDMI